ncbi:helix-turn-helix domain-containing protein [Allokutzneria sp. A3M-2-11 16]|uniref:GlxA family transcriptional regulator n=1 Tax=Allokutzneria sp. A3M-2-11 16 TaxID=2962043 RepID=UPI0020B7B2BF|nr:helix-turn-helix domain-containing protein [Allokutzneria sp. A3M-2-11 16]MCP3804071.1 helix-turn-helix domain-containing protein [Allokutzneria sp. A3M-2-11 16]
MANDRATHRVVVLALDGVLPFELGIPARIFGAARDASGRGLYTVTTCGVDGRPVVTASDFAITVAHDATALRTADTVVIPPSHTMRALCAGSGLPEEVAAALAEIRPGTRLAAICTSSFVLAAAGLLDGRRVTTHWREAENLRRTFPAVRVDPNVLFVDDGDVLTSAGVTAGVDLCLHIVRRDHGSEVANEVARTCVAPPWRDGGQAQYVQHPVPKTAPTTTAVARAWAADRLDQPIGLAEFAASARMSRRTFTRRFRAETGLSPGEWLTVQRVERVRHLLESTDLPIELLAARTGFGTAESLRQHFRGALGVSPSSYRRTFRGPDLRSR